MLAEHVGLLLLLRVLSLCFIYFNGHYDSFDTTDIWTRFCQAGERLEIC